MLTGDETNSVIRLWDTSISDSWACTQTVRINSEAGGLRRLSKVSIMDDAASLVAITTAHDGKTDFEPLCVLHLQDGTQSGNAGHPAHRLFDHLCELWVSKAIFSMSITTDSNALRLGGPLAFNCFSIHNDAIQVYHLASSQLYDEQCAAVAAATGPVEAPQALRPTPSPG